MTRDVAMEDSGSKVLEGGVVEEGSALEGLKMGAEADILEDLGEVGDEGFGAGRLGGVEERVDMLSRQWSRFEISQSFERMSTKCSKLQVWLPKFGAQTLNGESPVFLWRNSTSELELNAPHPSLCTRRAGLRVQTVTDL